MAGSLSTKGSQIALDAATGTTTQTARTMYLALWTAALAAASTPATAGEYSVTGYARQTCAMASASAASPSQTQNSAQLTFGPLTGATGGTAVTYAALVSSSSGTTGDLVAWWQLNASRTPAAGDSLQVAASGLTLTCAG